jgi:hypothetical protein
VGGNLIGLEDWRNFTCTCRRRGAGGGSPTAQAQLGCGFACFFFEPAVFGLYICFLFLFRLLFSFNFTLFFTFFFSFFSFLFVKINYSRGRLVNEASS